MRLTEPVITALTLSAVNLSLLIRTTYFASYEKERLVGFTPTNGSKYDYIVVGSGSSGSVVAGRLAEAGNKILLVEAGGPAHFLQEVPGMLTSFLDSPYDWGYKLKEQRDNIAGVFNDRIMKYPRGKSLGGTGMINGMLYYRGHRKDYDEWEELGNPGWGWESVLPFFKSAEKWRGNTNPNGTYGTEGRFNIMYSPFRFKIAEIIADALRTLGIPIGDVHTQEYEDEGFWHQVPVSLRDGLRLGTFREFVDPVHEKVDVLTFSVASKVILDKGRAKGIEVKRFGKTLEYFACNEVILSAGALGSPQILMLSGIGPNEELLKHGIRPVIDLPVGQNLQDHCSVLTPLKIGKPEGLRTLDARDLVKPTSLFEFYGSGGGPFNHRVASMGVMRAPSNKLGRPDLQFQFYPDFSLNSSIIQHSSYNWNLTVLKHLLGTDGDTFTMSHPTVLRPKSVGSLVLSGPGIDNPPIIDPNYLDHADDVRVLIEGVKVLKKMEETEAFKKHDIHVVHEKLLCGGQDESFSDAYLECFAREYMSAFYHPVSTCRMGPRGQKSVVDSRLRVHGITGLRVVDASIMPKLVGGNTEAACVMIGEKGASMIIEDSEMNPAKMRCQEDGRFSITRATGNFANKIKSVFRRISQIGRRTRLNKYNQRQDNRTSTVQQDKDRTTGHLLPHF